MNEFKACLKKDYLDQMRTKKFLRFSLIAVGLALFTFLTFAIVTLVPTEEGMPTELMQMFELTYANSILYFAAFMAVYFTVLAVVMMRGSISKERRDKKWILPIASGVDSHKMVASKIIVWTSSLIISMLIGCLVHLIGTVIFFEKAGSNIGTLFANYASILLFSLFIFICTISIDAIFNKPMLSAFIPIIFLMFGSSILNSITIKGVSLLNYSPWLLSDANIFLNPSSFSALEWVLGIGSYVGIMAILIYLALTVGQNKKEK